MALVMVVIGYKLCSEERSAPDLVADARAAEEAGFAFAAISDHFHPWIDAQGESPFVWSVLGAIAEATTRMTVGTAVTCPTVRMHPAVVAQAAATAATLLPDRFFLGVGTGENLNEHVVGGGWPNATTRRWMLEEAVEMIRALWSGEAVTLDGEYHLLDNARLYSLPEVPPPIFVAASGPESAMLAGAIGDGLIATAPDRELVHRYVDAGGTGPRVAELLVCVDVDEERALHTATEHWPIPGIPGELTSELPLPRHFEQATKLVSEEDLRGSITVGADPDLYLRAIRTYVEAGFDYVVLHQVGTDQRALFEFASEALLPMADRSFAAA